MEELFKNLYFADFEVTSHDWILVIMRYGTKEKFVFHNDNRDKIQTWIDERQPILCGYNFNYYDKYILKGILAGLTVEEIKKVNDHIIGGGQGWEFDFGNERVELPPIWDLMQDIVPMKSLKEIEGNLCMDITESTVDFTVDHKLTQEEYDEMVYYCEHDVEALFPLFDIRKDYFEAKFIISEMGNIDPIYGMSLTNAKLTALFLNAKRVERNDKNDYQYPPNFELEKIEPSAKQYFDEFINGVRDIDEGKLELKINETEGNIGAGGIHLAINNYEFQSSDFNPKDYKEEE